MILQWREMQCAQKQNIAEYSNSGITQSTNPYNIEKIERLHNKIPKPK